MTAPQRDYYNRRIGRDGQPSRLTLAEVSRQLAAIYRTLDSNGYLQRSFGYDCVDAGEVPGQVGTDFRMEFFMRTGIRIEGAIFSAIEEADEIMLFTIAEFIHDHVAQPLPGEGHYHPWNNCGLHLDHRRDKFDVQAGRAAWRDRLNGVLKFYEDGYQLSTDGEIVHLAPDGMARLIAMPAPVGTEDANAAKLANAVHTFQLGRSTREQRKQAVRDLVDILEYHRPAVVAHLGKDSEKELFNIANNFALRHHRATQKDDYDDGWLTWMFYSNLAAVHLVLARVAGREPFAEPVPLTNLTDSNADDIPF